MLTQPDQQKRPQCKKISSLFSLTRHFTKYIFLEQLTAMPQFNMQNVFFFFFLSSYHDTNPLLHLYHFRKKYILANINSESSRVIFFLFFCLHPVGKTFLYPSKFCDHLSTVLNNKKIFIYNLRFGLSKLYTNIQQDQKAKLDYHMLMLFAYIAGGEGVGVRGFKMFCQGLQNFSTCFVCVWGGGGGGQVQYLSFREKNNRPPPINK